jgi:glycosyltransferase involved in cell wall biosynthesis
MRNCLHSVFSQDFPVEDIEVIIVDGGSKDGTISIANEFKVKIIHNKFSFQDSKYGSRNIGLAEASGDFVCFLNADQTLLNRAWIRTVLEPLLRDETVSIAIARQDIRPGSLWLNRYNTYCEFPFVSSIARASGVRSIYEFFDARRTLTVNVARESKMLTYVGSGMLIRRNILNQVGGYDYDLDTAQRFVAIGQGYFATVPGAQVSHEHYLSNSITEYIRHKLRYLNRYVSLRELGLRSSLLEKKLVGGTPSLSRKKILLVLLGTVTLWICLLETVAMIKKRRDWACLLHPLLYLLVAAVYAMTFLRSRNMLRS